MDDLISRRAALEACSGYFVVSGRISRLSPIQPADNLQKLADEIASFKRHVKSDNSDYLTGYLCALSVVEGMIADMREVTP